MFEDILGRIAQLLDEIKISYMIIGGQAVLIHGEPRLTRDIDITLGIGVKDSDLILDNIKQIGLSAIPTQINEFISKTFVLPAEDDETGIRVDFIFSQTEYESEAIKRAINVKVKNTDVKFASIEDLIIHKIFSGRPRDIEDIKVIMVKKPEIDIEYIVKWLSEFDKALEKKEFVELFKSLLNRK